ncbi:hypothetical protein PL921480198 [Planktothrix tepida PCC 9214]|uniref:Uncharacterized protein n=1 Tax=Planktothrix tepida PCC 9214 TaxID=671072 RepID=A0A1J1LU12_9CYAN|nr:hypothetical protein PL921480198 [Planktothrix tepida PCC 9214]
MKLQRLAKLEKNLAWMFPRNKNSNGGSFEEFEILKETSER